jgi:hypothetical protein
VIAGLRIEDPYPIQPVALCVEILSAEDRRSTAFAAGAGTVGVFLFVLEPVIRGAETAAHSGLGRWAQAQLSGRAFMLAAQVPGPVPSQRCV